MAATLSPGPHADRVPVPLLAWLAVALAVAVLYVMLQENGALMAHSWEYVHELFHDGRHALGVPCH